MAYYNKIGLLVLSPDQTQFLVCQKDSLTEYILPGGKIEAGESHIQCIQREIREELDTQVDLDSLEFVGDYTDIAAGHTDRDVNIILYRGKLLGQPQASQEILSIHRVDSSDPKLSHIIRTKVLPDIISKYILK